MIHPITLSFPHLPAALDGLRIAHLSDFHARRGRCALKLADRLAAALAATRLDLVLLTGDYMDQPGDEATAIEVLARIASRVRPRLGYFGVFGNHDNTALRRQMNGLEIHWLGNGVVQPADLPLLLCGLDGSIDARPDTVALAGALAGTDAEAFRIALTHVPAMLPAVADLGCHLLLAGHTHGGQIRPWRRLPLYNSTDLPLRLSSGVLRHRETLAVVTRGLGETSLPLRLCCPRQVPVLMLRCGPLPGEYTDDMVNVWAW